ncbi:primosomal protein N'' [Peribacillus deserti]|uniref:Primosomal protein N n=1 Tax=Peribacillus deserti TaxID=673318 RepID=A0ABS2QNE9_9BACI|nr:primosomal protein N'' [Peribacillus deserti]
MSLDHLRTMLNSLKHHCEISLNFNDNNYKPFLFVCYKNNLFEVINAQTLVVDTFETIESTLTAIDNEIEHKFKKTSN